MMDVLHPSASLRRTCLRWLVRTRWLMVVIGGLSVPSLEVMARPNVILIMCDDLGWGDVGFNGGETIKTPHLDAMAKDAVTFTRFYAQAPVCSPTRGSCLTGRHPYRYGVYTANRGHLKPQEVTLAERLRDAGYVTGHFGKWHLGTMTTAIRDSNRGGRPGSKQHFSPPQANGFDVCFSTEAKVPTYDPLLKPPKAGNQAWDAIADRRLAKPYGTFYWNESGQQVTEPLYGDDSQLIMDRALDFVDAAIEEGTNFLAVIWFHSPHLPVVAAPEFAAHYVEEERMLHRNYYGCVAALDAQVGRLRAHLREHHVAKDTLITFCSDNGPEGNRQDAPGSAGAFRGRKRSLYEGGIRVPALIEWPGHAPRGMVTNFPAVTSDYMPTILSAVGVEAITNRPIDGISLLPVFSGELTERSQPIGFQTARQLAFTGDRYKLVGDRRSGQWELFDLIVDPSETTDLSDRMPERVQQMAQAFSNWQASCTASDEEADY